MPDEMKKDQTAPEEERPEIAAEDAAEETETELAEEETPAEAEPAETEPEEATAAEEEAEAGAEDAAALRAALEAAEKQRDEYLAMAQRATADYQNFKRRNGAARTEAYDDGVRETIAAILPVIDNLERAIAAAESENSALVSGVQMTLKQMLETLTRLGLEEVPALGEKFDPDIHNAVMRAPEGEGEPGRVLEVFQKGYRVKGRMIRYAMVKIAAEN
ncbi:MAG: nucleotide exchange factor GrpE [Clostridia bacterium]|nr:nucleotide exchange factor GrpE [Clostridia bacterium]